MSQQASSPSVESPAAASAPGARGDRLAGVFGIDLRTLALFRIGLGAMLLGDLILRSRDIAAFYSDWGLWPRGAMLQKFSDPSVLSIHLVGGQAWFIAALFAVAAALAVMMIAGYRTRLATALSWFLLMSLQTRNTMIGDGGDDFLRCMMFWSMFLPLGARFSIDSLLNTLPPGPHRYASVATAALLLQVCFVYVFSAALKWHPAWLEGRAVAITMQLDMFVTPLGVALRDYPDLMRQLNYFTLVLEFFGPLAAMLPWGTRRVRPVIIALFVLFHLGLASCLRLGLFPAICITAWLAFIPGGVWDRLPRIAFPPQGLRSLLVRRLRPRPVRVGRSRLADLVLAFFLIYSFFWNVRTVQAALGEVLLPPSWNWMGLTVRMDQRWGMFAPYPLTQDGWYVAPGRTVDGTQVDVMSVVLRDTPEHPVIWDKPALGSDRFPNSRWRKYLTNLWVNHNPGQCELFAGYLCRRWDQTHSGGMKMDTFRIFYMLENTRDDATPSKPAPQMIWQHWCIKMPQPPAESPPAATRPAASQPQTRPATQPAAVE